MSASDLCDVSLLHIFSFLSRPKDILQIRQVCRRWRKISEEKSFWRNCNLRVDKNSSQAVYQILNIAPALRSLQIVYYDFPNSLEQSRNFMAKILEGSILELRSLEIVSIYIFYEDLKTLLNRFSSSLVHLKFSDGGILWSGEIFNYENKAPVIKGLLKLKSLHTNLESTEEGPFSMDPLDWPSLEELYVQDYWYESASGLLDLIKTHKLLCLFKHQLRKLKIDISRREYFNCVFDIWNSIPGLEVIGCYCACLHFEWEKSATKNTMSCFIYPEICYDCEDKDSGSSCCSEIPSDCAVLDNVDYLHVVFAAKKVSCITRIIQCFSNVRVLSLEEDTSTAMSSENCGSVFGLAGGEVLALHALNRLKKLQVFKMKARGILTDFDSGYISANFPHVQIEIKQK